MHVCSQLVIFVSTNENKEENQVLLAYYLLFYQTYDTEHVKTNIFIPSLDLVDLATLRAQSTSKLKVATTH
jgi:hypothetical protein